MGRASVSTSSGRLSALAHAAHVARDERLVVLKERHDIDTRINNSLRVYLQQPSAAPSTPDRPTFRDLPAGDARLRPTEYVRCLGCDTPLLYHGPIWTDDNPTNATS